MKLFTLVLLLPLATADRGRITHTSHPIACSTPRARREWRAMSASDQSRYIQAIKRLQAPGAGGASEYDRFAQTHGDNSQPIHGVACFLPWHRYFLYQYEKALQAVDPQISLAYWGWQLDSQAPEASPIWKTFGGNGGGNGGCVTDGEFRGFKPRFIEPNSGLANCLVRQWNGAGGSGRNRIGAFDNPESINMIMSSSRDFKTFAVALEGRPHAVVHNNIGGIMQTMYSPNDPVFWMHHANLDKMWADWQALSDNNKRSYGGTNADRSQATAQDTLPLYPNVRVSQVLDTRSLCYFYEALTRQAADQATPKLPPTTVPKNPRREERKNQRRGGPKPGKGNGNKPNKPNKPNKGPKPGKPNKGPKGNKGGGKHGRGRRLERRDPRGRRQAQGHGGGHGGGGGRGGGHGPGGGRGGGHGPGGGHGQGRADFWGNPGQGQGKQGGRLIGALPKQNAHNAYLIPPPQPDIKPIDANVKVEPKPEGASAVADDSRSNLGKLAVLAPIPEPWILKNGLNLAVTRQQEVVLNNVTYNVNHIPGYTSPACLYNNPNLLAHVIQTSKPEDTKNFYMDIGDQRLVVGHAGTDPLAAAANIRARCKESVENPDAFKAPMEKIATVLATVIGPPCLTLNSAMNPYGVKDPKTEKGYGKESASQLNVPPPKSFKELMQSVSMDVVQQQTTLAQERKCTVHISVDGQPQA